MLTVDYKPRTKIHAGELKTYACIYVVWSSFQSVFDTYYNRAYGTPKGVTRHNVLKWTLEVQWKSFIWTIFSYPYSHIPQQDPLVSFLQAAIQSILLFIHTRAHAGVVSVNQHYSAGQAFF